MGIVTGVVSLWLAKIDNEDSLDNFTEITYTADGDLRKSAFGEYFNIGHYDEDFQEYSFLGKYSKCLTTLLDSFSYDEIIVPKFAELFPELQDSFNSAIMIYNYLYDGKVQKCTTENINCKFLCYVNYK